MSFQAVVEVAEPLLAVPWTMRPALRSRKPLRSQSARHSTTVTTPAQPVRVGRAREHDAVVHTARRHRGSEAADRARRRNAGDRRVVVGGGRVGGAVDVRALHDDEEVRGQRCARVTLIVVAVVDATGDLGDAEGVRARGRPHEAGARHVGDAGGQRIRERHAGAVLRRVVGVGHGVRDDLALHDLVVHGVGRLRDADRGQRVADGRRGVVADRGDDRLRVVVGAARRRRRDRGAHREVGVRLVDVEGWCCPAPRSRCSCPRHPSPRSG